MRAVAGIAVVVAAGALALSVFAIRDARRADRHASVAASQTHRLQTELAIDRTQLAQLAHDRLAVQALCHAARNASITNSSAYAVTVARAIIKGIDASCNYGHVPEIP